MYAFCPLNDTPVCPVCSYSLYDPITGQCDDVKRIFCGHLTGADTTISGFSQCVLKIPAHKRRAIHNKKSKILEAKRLMLKM